MEEDLYADPDLSKNIHNDANNFYRQVMNLKTPIKAGEIDTDKLRKAISDIPETSPLHEFLSKLHRSPWKGIWPSAEQPPNEFVGKLWLGVRESYKSGNSDDHKNKDANEPYIRLEQFINQKNKMLIDPLTYFKLLQDKGFLLEGNKRPKKSYITKKANGLLDRGYKDIYHLSTLFYDIMNHNKKTFKLPKNKSAVVNKIGKLIMDN